MDDSALLELDEAEQDLLRLYEAAGITAMTIKVINKAIVVRCQDAADVGPLCRRVAAEHEAPTDRTLQ